MLLMFMHLTEGHPYLTLTFYILVFCAVLFYVLYTYITSISAPPTADPDGVSIPLRLMFEGDSPGDDKRRVLVLPGVDYCNILAEFSMARRKYMDAVWKKQQIVFENRWSTETPQRRLAILQQTAKGVRHAVSNYVDDAPLFSAICPEIGSLGEPNVIDSRPSELVEDGAFDKLMGRACAGKIGAGDGRGIPYQLVSEIMGEAADANGESKSDRAALKRFLPSLRRLCVYSFVVEVVQEVTGKRDGGEGGEGGEQASNKKGGASRGGLAGMFMKGGMGHSMTSTLFSMIFIGVVGFGLQSVIQVLGPVGAAS